MSGFGSGRFGMVHKCVEKSSGLTLAAKIIKTRNQKEKVNGEHACILLLDIWHCAVYRTHIFKKKFNQKSNEIDVIHFPP